MRIPISFTALFLLLTLNLFAQAPNTYQPPQSFNAVIPGLNFFKSGYPRVKSTQKKDYKAFFNSNDTSAYTFVGFKVTSKEIRDKVGAAMVNESQIFFVAKPTLKSLNIYADTLELTEDLWLPEANIDIQVKVLVMNKKNINSSPIPHRAAKDRNFVSPSDNKNGIKGRNAGKITITADQLVKGGKLIANGTGGGWVHVPEVTVKHPKYKETLKLGFKGSCEATGCPTFSFNRQELYNRRIVSTEIWSKTEKWWGQKSKKCYHYEKFDDHLGWTKSSGDCSYENPNKIKDGQIGKRISFTYIKPGAGGNGNQIIFKNTENDAPTMEVNGGETGYYIPRASSNYTFNKGIEGRCIAIEFKQTEYYHYKFKLHCNNGKDDMSWRNYSNYFTVPSYEDRDKFNDKLSLNAPNRDGKNGSSKISISKYFPHPEQAILNTSYLKDQFSIFSKKTPSEKEKMAEESAWLIKQFNRIDTIYNFQDGSDLESRFRTAMAEALELSQMKHKNLDEFNNPPGYRPVLSMTSTLQYIEKHLKDDLYLYVFADKMARKQESIGDLKKKLPGMINKLYQVNTTLGTELGKVNQNIQKLSSDALECKAMTMSINSKIDSLKVIYEKKATKEQKKQEWYKTGLKVCALAANVIPYGQPVLGQVAGNTLDQIANSIGLGENPDASTIIKSIDMTGMMKGLSEKKMGKFKGRSVDNYELELNELYETNKVKDLVIKGEVGKRKEAIAEYQKNVDESKKRWVEAGNGLKNILADHLSCSASTEAINKQLAKIMNDSPEAQELFSQLRLQLEKKEEIFAAFQDNAQKALDLNHKILLNSDQIKYLNTLSLDGVDYMPELQNHMTQMRQAARERLDWIDYQLVKVYEYAHLDAYSAKNKLASSEVLDKIYQTTKPDQTSVEELVKKLYPGYLANIKAMKNNILRNISKGHKQDAKGSSETGIKYGRSIFFDKDTRPDLFDQLNSNKRKITIDLQQDLNGVIIQPDEENARIIDLSLDSAVLDQLIPKGKSVKIKIELGKEGVLQSKNAFYQFNTERENSSPDSWSWTIGNPTGNKNVITNFSELSENYKALIKLILGKEKGGKQGENENIFTLPPAWNTMNVYLKYQGFDGRDLPKLEQFYLSMRLDYKSIPERSSFKMVAVKMQNAPYGTGFEVSCDSAIQSYGSYYNTHLKNREITVSLNKIQSDSNTSIRVFKEWKMNPNFLKEGDEIKEKITFLLKDNVALTAVFEEDQMVRNVGLPAQEYVLYSEPSEQSEPIAWVSSKDDFKVLKAQYKNGFAMVHFDLQVAYVRLEGGTN